VLLLQLFSRFEKFQNKLGILINIETDRQIE
jgi:hypothetical protein